MRRYLFLAGLVTMLAAFGAAAFNWVVDPYGIFGAPGVAGFNAVKPRAGQRGWLAKVYRIQNLRPRGLILGNSRAEVGLDPEHPAWPADARPILNAALPGTGPAAAFDLLSLALRVEPPRTVMLGVDFLDFRTAPNASPDAPPPAPDPLALPRRLRDYRDTLFSVAAVRDSVATVISQRDPYARDLTALGFNPMRDHAGIARTEGYRALFDQKDQDNARSYLRGPKLIFVPGTRRSDAFESLRATIGLAASRRIELRLVIYPYHARILELFHEAGLWNAFEDWKRALVDIVEQTRTSHPDAHVELWDFSGYSPITAEAVPIGRGAEVSMQWYWEAGHFKKALGDRMLHQMLLVPQEGEGVRLTPENIEHEIMRLHEGRSRYLASRAEESAAMRALISRMRATHGRS